MRPPGRSVLSAILVTGSLLVTACTTASTIDAAAPESPQNSADGEPLGQDPDRGVTAAPLPAVTPTVSSEASGAIRQPASEARPADGLTERERAALEPSPLGIPSVVDRNPLWYGSNHSSRENDLASVAYDQIPLETELALAPNGPFHRTIGVTPDDSRVWITLADPLGATTCPEGEPGSVLATMPLDSSEPPRFAQPNADLPANISAVHAGPEDHVLLYSSCGRYSAPVAFARVTSDGDFTNVRPLHEVTESVLFTYAPRWMWAFEAGGDHPREDTGRLVAIIPQLGVSAPGDATHGPADIYIDVESGAVLDVFPAEGTSSMSIGYSHAVGSGEGLYLNRQSVEDWTGPVWVMRAQRGFAADGSVSLAVGGEDGALVLSRHRLAETTTARVSSTAVTDLQWTPSGEALVISDDDGTRIIVGDNVTQLSAESGGLHFTRDGSTLVLAAERTHFFTFAPTPTPDDSTRITPFSQLDSGGLGPIRIDMSVSEVGDLLDIELTLQTIGEDNGAGACAWISSPDLGPISMLAETTGDGDARITAIRVDSGPWSTPSGLRVGSSEDEIRTALDGQLRENTHVYVPGNYLTFVPTDPADPYGVKFETNGHEAFAVHVGHHQWISYVEGCA